MTGGVVFHALPDAWCMRGMEECLEHFAFGVNLREPRRVGHRVLERQGKFDGIRV